MTTYGLHTITEKEFSDHIRSRRFHLLFGILIVIAVIGMITGVVQYTRDISDYNSVQMIAQSEESAGIGDLAMLKPSILTAYSQMGILIAGVGVMLGIAMGFDLITREKESKSLKTLLSYPIFRDEVINGKALGGIGAIALAMGVVLVISLAILIILGIVPDFDEFIRILIFGAVSFLLVFAFFSLSLLMSAVSKDSGSALIYSLVVMILLSSLIPVFSYGPVYSAVFGEPPSLPGTSSYSYQQSSSVYSTTTVGVMHTSGDEVDSEALEEYERASRQYMAQKQAISDVVTLVSPTGNYQAVLGVVARSAGVQGYSSGESGTAGEMGSAPQNPLSGLAELLGSLAYNIVALIAMPAAFFGLAWVRFMREDVR